MTIGQTDRPSCARFSPNFVGPVRERVKRRGVYDVIPRAAGGVFATDSTNAAYTFLMNIDTLEWDRTLLRFFGISAGCLPKIKTSSEVYGKVADGPLAGVRVSGVLGNRQAALVGHRCFRRGLAKATLAGSGTAFVVTGPDKVFSGNGLLTTVAYQLDASPVYALEGPIASAGRTVEWTKKCLDVRENECSTTAEHRRGALNSVYLVPAFAGEKRVSRPKSSRNNSFSTRPFRARKTNRCIPFAANADRALHCGVNENNKNPSSTHLLAYA